MGNITTFVYRGKNIESIHKVNCLLSDLSGNILFSTGADQNLIYPRSAIKIFQAIPFANSKAIDNYKLNSKQIALACSSHTAEKFHIIELSNWLKKLRINRKNLKCGIHNPLHKKSSDKLLLSGIKPNQLHNNCAGKHLGMLSACKANKLSIKHYLDFDHLHQIEIKKTLELFSENKLKKNNYGIDGCSAPQYALKIENISVALRNLVNSYLSVFHNSNSVKILLNSILNNPMFIGGSNNLDSNIIKVSNKKIFCKGGAEGVLLFADLKKKIVGVIKVADGNERALPSVVFELFKKFKILSNSELNKLYKWNNFKILNHASIQTGFILTKINE